MQASRYHNANPKLKINTNVSGTADAPEVVFKFVDDTEVRKGMLPVWARANGASINELTHKFYLLIMRTHYH